MTSARLLLAVLVASVLFSWGSPSRAQDAAEEENLSADEIARQLANPNASLASLVFPFDFTRYGGDLPGASDQSAFKLSFQPSFPYPLGESTNFFLRPLIPVLFDQPVPVVGDQPVAGSMPAFEDTGVQLGDIAFDAAVGKTFESGLVTIGGVVGTLPTATDDRVGLNQYLLGPEVFIGGNFDWGFAGVLVSHQWDVAGDGDFATSITGGQYFYTINLSDGWQIQAQPTFSYNHEAESGNRLVLPVGVGVSKTVVPGKTPWKLGLQLWYYVARPEAFGPQYQIRFQVAPVVPLPW